MILDLCGGTGSWSKPYTDNGYDVRVLTLPDFDVTKWQECEWLKSAIKENEIEGILAAPPCTMFSIATGYSKRVVLRRMTPLGFANAFYTANK